MVAQRASELIYKGPDGEALASADERDLTIAFKSGSEDAYSVIYGRYRPRVESLCRRMLNNPHDAQEATQEAFLRVFQSLHSFNGRYQLGAWITRIATNVCLDTLRVQARRPSQPTPIEEMELSLRNTGTDSDPEFFVIRRAESRRVRRVLESLPPMHRAAIILRDFEGLTYGEIAIALGITDSQVKALLHRARGGFKRAWNPASVASIFLPARFVNRFRKIEPTVSEQANQVARTATPLADAAASASQAASSCGAFIQSCGAVVTERFAAAATAVVVTAGAVSGVGASPAEPVASPTVLASVDTGPKAPQTKGPTKTSDRNRDDVAPATEVPAVVPVPEPIPEPTPSPEPTPPPEPPEPSPDPTPTPDPDAAPVEPSGFSLGFSVTAAASGAPCCLWDTAVESEYVGVNDQGLSALRQSLRGAASAAGTPAYGLQLQQWSGTGSDHGMEFRLYTSEGSYVYSATGSLVDRARTEWGGWVYRYRGTFRLGSRPTRSEAMPESGTYAAEIVISPATARVVSESFSLGL